MKKIHEFIPANRYAYDFGPCSASQGYAQVDTLQDASYYGTWCSPTARTIVNYCEGDVTTTVCETDAEFVEQLHELARWNDEGGWGPMRIDPGLGPELREQLVRLGVENLLH